MRDDLSTALAMALAAKRPIAVRTTDNIDTRIGKLFDDTEVQSFDLEPDIKFIDFASHLRLDAAGECVEPKLLVLNSIQGTSKDFQRSLHLMIRTSNVDLMGQNYSLDDMFTIVFVNAKGVLKPLLNDIWFEHEDVHKETSELPSIPEIRQKVPEVVLSREVETYTKDVVIFTRTNRFIIGGVPTFIFKDFIQFSKTYAAVVGYDFVVPSMVQVAAYKLLPLHITLLTDPEDEPSVHYSGDPRLVKQILSKVDTFIVIEDVLRKVQPPV